MPRKKQRRTTPEKRRRDVGQLFYELGWEHLEDLEWDGEDLDELRSFLSEDEYQAVLDHLGDGDAAGH